jgi:hypothetical protein
MNVSRCDQLPAAGGGINCSACGHGATKLRLLIESKPKLSILVLTRFLDANRTPGRIESGRAFAGKRFKSKADLAPR